MIDLFPLKQFSAAHNPNRHEEADAANHNELHRGLKSRHAQMISIGGVIGTGLFLGTAGSLASGGPLGLLLGYLIVSSACISVMLCLGELTTLLPVPGGQITLSARFVDPAMSFAMGWNYWFSWIVTLPAELSAAAILVHWWDSKMNGALWISVTLVVAVAINFMGSRAFGETEFWFASVKILTIVGLIILGLVIDLGGAPNHDRLGFRYWHHPGPLVQFNHIPGSLGRFAGFWSVLIGAAYSFTGTEIIGITAAEIRNPRKNIPRAIRGVWIRIFLFYNLSVFILGLICPFDNKDLTDANKSGTVSSSAWVIAIQIAEIKVLPSVVNACFLTSAWSAASSNLYTSSRVLYGLAKNGQAPKIFSKVNRFGTPVYAVSLSAVLALLSFIGAPKTSPTVFLRFSSLSGVSGMFNWVGICITAMRFRAGLKAQGIDPRTLPWHSALLPYAAWWGLFWVTIIILFADWGVFLHGNWDAASFVTNYLPIPVFVILYFGYKIIYNTRYVSTDEMDFVTGITGFREPEF